VAVLTYKALHNTSPRYLEQLVRVADILGLRALRFAVTDRLVVPPVRLHAVDYRAFPVAAPKIWNSLPDNIVSFVSFSTFCRLLKTFCLMFVSDLIL